MTMKPRRTRSRRLSIRHGFLTLAILSLVAALSPLRMSAVRAQAGDQLVVIISAAAGISDISLDAVRSAFLGRPVEYRGVRLVPLNLPVRNPTRERLDRALLGLEPSEVGSFWIDQRVRDGRQPPRTVPSPELATRVVASLKGAIAAVPVDAAVRNVRALRIDGKAPSHPDYPLKATR